MSRRASLLVFAYASVLGACGGAPTSQSGTGDTSDTSAMPVAVTWIDVVASDYTLELVPEFDRSVTDYQAIADGPDIAVWVDVIVNADVDSVRVNGVEAKSAGFRLWRSTPETGLVSPTTIALEVVGGDGSTQTFDIDVVHD